MSRSYIAGRRNQTDRLPELAADLVRRQVAVIAATGGPASALAAKLATTTIPIVFGVPEDPVKLGLVASLARPGGNLTGINFFTGELGAKQLGLLRELVPGAARIAALINPANVQDAATAVAEVEVAARTMGLQIQVFNASTGRELNTAFGAVARAERRAFYRWRPLFHRPAGTTCNLGGALCDSCIVCRA